jgi:NAD(P)-dependent dehydrogenase (short-subunit alcohol dehydrogenase family)
MNTLSRTALWAAAGAGLLLGLRASVRYKRKYDYYNKVVFLTGGARGLGLEMARILAKEGAHLAICSRNSVQLEKARQELSTMGASVLTLVADVQKEDEVNKAIEKTRQHFGQIDVLINNAGFISVGPLENMTTREFDEAMRTHFWGPLYTMKAVLPEMKERRSGRIINVSSLAGIASLPHMVPYSASKSALISLSEGFREEFIKDNIYITLATPGLIRTGAHENAAIKGEQEDEFAWFSVLDANRLTAMEARKAARQILEAGRFGVSRVTMPIHASLLSAMHGAAPGLTSDFLSLLNMLLPNSTTKDTGRLKGYNVDDDHIPDALTYAGDKAARRNNEY